MSNLSYPSGAARRAAATNKKKKKLSKATLLEHTPPILQVLCRFGVILVINR